MDWEGILDGKVGNDCSPGREWIEVMMRMMEVIVGSFLLMIQLEGKNLVIKVVMKLWLWWWHLWQSREGRKV